MSASHRTFRADVYAYSSTDNEGLMTSAYTRSENAASTDGKWWASVAYTASFEGTQAGQAQQRIDAVLGFGPEVPLTDDGAVRADGRVFKIVSLLPREYGIDEQQVEAVFVAEETVNVDE